MIWHFVRAGFIARQLAKDVAACRSLAQHGDAKSQFTLGSMYYHGKGVTKDYAEALRWYRKAAEQGDSRAEYGLGSMYYRGEGVAQDYSEAARWYRKSAEQGYVNAQDRVSYMYREGQGVSRDYAWAATWSRKAAEQGDAWAQDNLGSMYYQGEGVPQDYAEAVRWYRKSAEQGFTDGLYNLGYMYYYGYGVLQDRVAANRFFQQAAARGNADARRIVAVRPRHLAPPTKITFSLQLLGSLYFGFAFLRSRQIHRTRTEITTGTLALLLLTHLVLDLYWYLYFSFPSSLAVTSFYFVRHLLSGVLIAMLLSIALPKSAKLVLVVSVALFTAFNLFQVVHYELAHIPPTIRLLWLGNGLFIGMSIPSAIVLWLDSKKTRGGLSGGGGGPTTPVMVK